MKLHQTSPLLICLLLGPLIFLGETSQGLGAGASSQEGGTRAAEAMLQSTQDGLYSEYNAALAMAAHLRDGFERQQASAQAAQDLRDGLDLAQVQFERRLSLNVRLGPAPYDPLILPANFKSGVDHPYHPLIVGRVLTYEKLHLGTAETVVIEVLPELRTILGVECMIVRDRVQIDGVILEDTLDYFAQDTSGNVWYFGELTINYEHGLIVDTEGSWIAGEDGAKPGIVMPADFQIGKTYRQEFLMGLAEDVTTLRAIGTDASTSYGQFANCIETIDQTPVEPGEFELKIYALGIGFIIEIDLNDGSQLELVSIDG